MQTIFAIVLNRLNKSGFSLGEDWTAHVYKYREQLSQVSYILLVLIN